MTESGASTVWRAECREYSVDSRELEFFYCVDSRCALSLAVVDRRSSQEEQGVVLRIYLFIKGLFE